MYCYKVSIIYDTFQITNRWYLVDGDCKQWSMVLELDYDTWDAESSCVRTRTSLGPADVAILFNKYYEVLHITSKTLTKILSFTPKTPHKTFYID